MSKITSNHAILSDIDLSLLPPASTKIEKWQQDLVESLENKLSGAFAVITGRGIQSVDKVFPGIAASVEQHSAWRPARGENLTALAPQIDIGELALLATQELTGKVELIKSITQLGEVENGIHVEHKQFSLALVLSHVFNEATRKLAGETAEKIFTRLPHLKNSHSIKHGSDSIEIGPSGADKGVAVRDFMASAAFKGRIPIYIGDGPTDIDAMIEVKKRGGFNLAVGPLIRDDSLIDLRVDTIEEVWDVLRSWDQQLAPR